MPGIAEEHGKMRSQGNSATSAQQPPYDMGTRDTAIQGFKH